MCEDIQADVEDGQLQFFYVLAFVLQGDICARSRRLRRVPSLLCGCFGVLRTQMSKPGPLFQASWTPGIRQLSPLVRVCLPGHVSLRSGTVHVSNYRPFSPNVSCLWDASVAHAAEGWSR